MPAPSPEAHPEPRGTEPEELALIAADFPSFCIWRSVTAYRSRYIAQSIDLNTHPYTVVTEDLQELVAALNASRS